MVSKVDRRTDRRNRAHRGAAHAHCRNTVCHSDMGMGCGLRRRCRAGVQASQSWQRARRRRNSPSSSQPLLALTAAKGLPMDTVESFDSIIHGLVFTL